MSFQTSNLRLTLTAQIASFYPATVIDQQQKLMAALHEVLKQHSAEGEYLVGAVRVIIEERNT